MEKNFNLEIVSPVSSVYTNKVLSVSAPGINGGFQVLFNHAPFVSTLGIGRVKITEPNNNELTFSISGGLFEVSNNNASIIAESIEEIKDIDIERAERALQRAMDRLKSSDSGIDKERARLSYERAKNRLALVKKK